VVFSRTTDRIHRHVGPPSPIVDVGKRRQSFRGAAVHLDCIWTLDAIERRLPGSLAALHQDYIHVRVPKQLTIRADDGLDNVSLEFIGRSATQLIMGDPAVRGYGFIHEIAGECSCVVRLGDDEVAGTGLGIFEYVC
jgi:hypothetical protein